MALTKIKTSGIADNAITNAKMADDAIDSADFADASIDLAHMSVNSIDSDQYVDGSIDNAHLAGSIAVSKTLLAGGTGLTLSTNTLAVDAAQTQITSVGTIGTGVWNGTAVASAYLDSDTAHLSVSQTYTGTPTFAQRLKVDTDEEDVAYFDSNHATGMYMVFQNAGSTFGYLGSAKSLISGSLASADLTIRSQNNLYFTTGGSGEDVKIDASGNATFAGDVTISGDITGGNPTTGAYFINNASATVGTPNYSFYNDSDTGMYRKDADVLAFSTGGTERVSISDSLNVDGAFVMGSAAQFSEVARGLITIDFESTNTITIPSAANHTFFLAFYKQTVNGNNSAVIGYVAIEDAAIQPSGLSVHHNLPGLSASSTSRTQIKLGNTAENSSAISVHYTIYKVGVDNS